MGCIVKLLAVAFSGFFFLLVAGVALGTYLTFSGAPRPCVDRSQNPAPEAGQTLSENWLELSHGISRGEEVLLSVTEDQASAIGAAYLEDRDVPFEELRVYFCPGGYAEATGRVGFLGLHSNVLVRGTLDVTGARPKIDIDSVRAGRFPELVARNIVVRLFDEERVVTLPLVEHVDAIEYRDGEAIVTASPN